MLLAEPPRTPYDFHFELFGFPIRVTPFFWLMGAVLGYGNALGYDQLVSHGNPNLGLLLVMWEAAFFLSILVHELGHAFVMRHYGMRAYIVLYHFGGLAVPDVMSSFFGYGSRSRNGNQIAISFAGPAAQLLLAAVIILAVRLTGHQFQLPLGIVEMILPPSEGQPLQSVALDAMLFFLVTPSIFWALLNLLPIFPLDGGYISREILTMFRGGSGFRDSLYLSIATAGAAAMYFFHSGSSFNAMLFISLALSSFQLLQTMRFGGGGW